jgi:hypothetical protein
VKNYRETKDSALVSLLPSYTEAKTLLASDALPCHAANIKSTPLNTILKELRREAWSEGLYARKIDLQKIKRYQNPDLSYKNDFDDTEFLTWVHAIEENTAICSIENKYISKGVFVPPGKTLAKGTFLPSSGIIKLDPTKEELETKTHCSALQNLDSRKREIVGFIDPDKIGGILDLINHAPEEDEMVNFKFRTQLINKKVATANLKSIIKFYNGYAIMGLEVIQDIHGGNYGTQLLWSYAHACEYFDEESIPCKTLLLFDNRDEHNGEIIPANNYSLKEINIFVDAGKLILRKVATLSRWELMDTSPESRLVISPEDPYSSTQSDAVQSPISYGYLQTYLKNNPVADRIIIKVTI